MEKKKAPIVANLKKFISTTLISQPYSHLPSLPSKIRQTFTKTSRGTIQTHLVKMALLVTSTALNITLAVLAKWKIW